MAAWAVPMKHEWLLPFMKTDIIANGDKKLAETVLAKYATDAVEPLVGLTSEWKTRQLHELPPISSDRAWVLRPSGWQDVLLFSRVSNLLCRLHHFLPRRHSPLEKACRRRSGATCTAGQASGQPVTWQRETTA